MSEKQPDTPVVHLPWSAWQDITARLDALEAREKARDACWRFLYDECKAAPPPPAAAPDVIERVREALQDALGCLGPEGYVPVFGKPKTDALREALRLLGDAP